MSIPVVLIPGAGGQAWVWHLVEADLRQRGYDAFAVDLPAADESKGLPAYADAVVSAIGSRATRCCSSTGKKRSSRPAMA